MNSRIYIFGNLENGYTQYPEDYTSEIFRNFYKQTTRKSQIIIHREGNLMYYGYIRTLNPDSQYIGFCIVVNGIMFSNIANLFLVFENAVSDMVSRGNILLLDDNGDLIPKTNSLNQHEKEIKRTAAIIGVDVSELENSAKKLPPVSLNSTKDESISFSVSDKNDDIVEASAKCGYTCVFKNTDSGATGTNTDKTVSDKPKEHGGEPAKTHIGSKSKRRYWPLAIIFLSVFGTLLCVGLIRMMNKVSSSTESTVSTDSTSRSNLPQKTVALNKATSSQKTAPSQEAIAMVIQDHNPSAKNTSKTESTPTKSARNTEEPKRGTEEKQTYVVNKEETAPQPVPSAPRAIDPNKIYYSYDVEAEFPGGKKARKNWLNDNISWPTDNSGNILHGDVELEFVVERDGRISNVKVTDSENPRLNSEAIRLIGSMPRWTPALLNSQPVRSAVSLTLFF